MRALSTTPTRPACSGCVAASRLMPVCLLRPQPTQCAAHHHSRTTLQCKAAVGDSHDSQHHLSQPSPQQHHQQQQLEDFQRVLSSVEQQPYQQLQQLIEDQPEHRAFSASFLFWLSAQEKKLHVGPRKQHLAQLAAQLVLLKEQAEAEASRRMLPPLASSLAYSNYTQWRSSHSEEGVDLPEVTPGVSLTDLYRAAEREEAKLKQWQSPQKPSSTLDNFAAASGYGTFAADAMARVRARLAGFEDDETMQQQQQQPAVVHASDAGQRQQQQQQPQQQGVSPAAVRVLDELLWNCCCREERATLLPEAFMPPGLEVSATGSPTSSSSGQQSSSAAKARVLTSPQRLLAAVAARLQDVQEQPPQGQEALQHQPMSQPSTSQQQQQQQQQPGLLPSGESVAQVLQELQEDIQEYDRHVYSRLSQRDRV